MLFLSHQVELKDIEVNIYNYITANIHKVCFMRIRDLANATHVSTTTILRFCKKFGCEGYSDFRLRLQLYTEELDKKALEVSSIDEMPFIEFLKRTSFPEFQEKINAAATILKETDLVLFVGIGTSSTMAGYGAMLYSSLFTLALNIEDPLNTPLYNISSNLDSKICLITISVSGENEDLIDCINQLKIHKSHIISITNSANSTISRLSDVNLPYYTNTEMYRETNITSQLPVTYILEMLARKVHQIKNEK
ncbi:MurR/RpiR family transcriptional regulator [Enterococcus sp. BWB1-3]|uniref:MurR/RpiR family transcriptional regulator n=1 Tax=unclassified Enterococcus TaxID=2608891 RepID=UPI0019230067|nr:MULTISPECIES: MurR/RpiR family transcriptional regulator [unclassified Enterococcus]MBL1229264.1 MurR/RpiR family transcriptional regulator [Enterococcus sp. BWB1-3]MCB5951754.1 MurR/RpiR family transcriptional regulator [Enterococcus sp. BWT-B8]MCB5953921.1 MurR/RpiR family transcriptional regulator [Enterococcus sp. CWB-B31]